MQHWARTVFDDMIRGNNKRSSRSKCDVERIIKILEESDFHHFRTEELGAMTNELYGVEDINDLSDTMWEIAKELGFQNFAIFVLKQGANGSFASRICTSFDSEWINRYLDQRYQFIDPVMAKASLSDGYFLYSELTNCSPAVESFWKDAEHHRVGRNGVCFSMSTRGGARIGVSFSTQGTATKVSDLFRKNGLDMKFVAQTASDAYCHIVSGNPLPNDTLNEHELRFLQFLSTSPNPKNALNTFPSPDSTANLQASISSKMGTNSVIQAVAIAASKGWFDLLPYDANEIVKSSVTSQRIGPEHDTFEVTDNEKYD